MSATTLASVPARRHPLLVAAGCQLGAAALAGAVALAWAALTGVAAPASALVLGTGLAAAAMGWRSALPGWWLGILAAFVPALYWGQGLGLDPVVYLGALLLCLLLLGNSVFERVPLYLSSAAVWNALGSLLPEGGRGRVLDLGCGPGGGLARLARDAPGFTVEGVETSPIPWLIARWRTRRLANSRVRFQNLWSRDLGGYDLVYAYLSPAPMARLWAKARAEMRPGSLLVSNGFRVPGVRPWRVLDLADGRGTRLYLWRM